MGLFGRRKAKASHEDSFDATSAALEALLGKADDGVLHSMVPLELGGFSDVLTFRRYLPGVAYVTAELIGSDGQKANRLGKYELMMCMRAESDWAGNLVSRLARYTLDAKLEPGETMDIGPAVPEGSSIEALLFTVPDLPKPTLDVLGVRAGLLLCIGITGPELAACHGHGASEVVAILKQKGIFPYTDLNRASACP